MNRKVDTAYFLNDPRKFDSVEQAEKELNRLRAVCIRLKKKQDEDITFLLGLSVTSSQWYGKMGYDKPKSEGGRKLLAASFSTAVQSTEIRVPSAKHSSTQAHAVKLEAGETTKEEYDRRRSRYPELDSKPGRVKLTPSQELSDMLTDSLKEPEQTTKRLCRLRSEGQQSLFRFSVGFGGKGLHTCKPFATQNKTK